MAHPAGMQRFFSALLLSPLLGLAQEATPAAPGTAAESPAPASRTVSPNVAALLAAASPRFTAGKPDEKSSGPASATIMDRPSNEIVRLPNFVVREPRVPTPEDVRTPRGLQIYAMNKYLGSPTGFSRGVLNRYTLADGWTRATKHIPVLNWFEWASSPEKTAVEMYFDDEVRKKMRDLYELQAIRSSPPPRVKEKTTSAPTVNPPPASGK